MVTRDRNAAIQAAWAMRHSNRRAAKAIINIIRDKEWFDSKVDEYFTDIWGAMYPDNPNGWEYPAQIVRHVGYVVKELGEAKQHQPNGEGE